MEEEEEEEGQAQGQTWRTPMIVAHVRLRKGRALTLQGGWEEKARDQRWSRRDVQSLDGADTEEEEGRKD